MKVVIASESPIKVAACKKVFNHIADVEIIPVKVPSNVNEQPMNEETLEGAFNRLVGAKDKVPNADVYISIENGLFVEDGRYIDKAVVIVQRDNKQKIVYSDGVEFPAAPVEEARKRGFDRHVSGDVMLELGMIKQANDPHLCLSGKSRVDILDETLQVAVKQIGL